MYVCVCVLHKVIETLSDFHSYFQSYNSININLIHSLHLSHCSY